MKSPGVLVLTVTICLASTGMLDRVWAQTCPHFGTDVTDRLHENSGKGLVLNLESPASCSGTLTEWHYCFYRFDTDKNRMAYFAVYRREGSTYNLVDGSYMRIDRRGSTSAETCSGQSPPLCCGTVAPDQLITVQEGDVLAACQLNSEPLDLVAEEAEGHTLHFADPPHEDCVESQIQNVDTNSIQPSSDFLLHLYANIEPPPPQPSSTSTTPSASITPVPSQTATTGITGAMMPSAMLAISALPTSFAEVTSSMALLSSSLHSTTQTETSSTSTPISSTPQPPASSRSRISSTLIMAFGATTTVVSPTMQPVSSSAVPFSNRTRTTPRTAETSTSFGRLTTTTTIPAPTSAPFSSSTSFLSSDETSTSFGRLTTTTPIPAPTSAPFSSSTSFLSSAETLLTTSTTTEEELPTTTSSETLPSDSSITEESPTPSPSPIQNESETATADRFGSGAIAGIMVAIVVVIILVLLSAAFIIYKKQNIKVYFVKQRKEKQSGNYGIVNATYEEIQGTTVPHFSTARSEVKISPVFELSEFSNEFSIPDYEPIPFTNENAAEVYYSSMGPSPDYYHLLEQAKEGDVSYYNENPYYIPASQEDEIYKQLRQQGIKRIPQEELEVTMFLGSGQFGNVEKAIWKSRSGMLEVAVKTLAPGSSDVDKVKFLQEAAIMAQFKHPNVVSLHGVVSHGEMIMLVVELLQKGDLRHFLKSIRPDPGELVPPYTPRQLLGFSKQVALGMQYLSVKGFVHRDLAARNILVSDNNLCKIGDFGMSRDLADENYYISHGGQIPLKWTAPEALLYRKYSTASDVWSYGCLLYEIWSLGHKPFEGYKNQEVLLKLETGYRLPPPPGCPKVIYELMIQCWNPDTASRPGFRNLLLALLENEEAVLHIPAEALAAHKQAGSLGVPLEVGQEMYPDCQQAYYTEMTAL